MTIAQLCGLSPVGSEAAVLRAIRKPATEADPKANIFKNSRLPIDSLAILSLLIVVKEAASAL
jgi:hypothetical protein